MYNSVLLYVDIQISWFIIRCDLIRISYNMIIESESLINMFVTHIYHGPHDIIGIIDLCHEAQN